jgi:cytochrome c-type biogenesis protein CcmH/NrfG
MANVKVQREMNSTPLGATPAWVALAILAVAVGLVYARSLSAPWIFDDSLSVLANRSITSLWPLVGDAEQPGPLQSLVENPMSARPLVNVSLAVNYSFGGLDPRGYRVVNILLHLANALLVWAVVSRTLRLPRFGGRFERQASWLALSVALVWAVHPLVTEAVVYVTQRTELMVAFFYLATLYASLRYWTVAESDGRRVWLAVAVVACLAGAASKEVMVTAPLVVALFDWTFIGGTLREMWRRSRPLYAGLAASWLVIGALQLGTPRGESAGFGLGVPLVAWWCTQAKVFVMYLTLAVRPWPLVLHYELPVESFDVNWIYVLATIGFAALAAALVWRRSALGFLLATVALVLAPTHVVPIVTEMAAERRMYLPLVALAVLAAMGVYWLADRVWGLPESRRSVVTATVLLLLVALAYGSASAERVAKFHDPLVLWQENIAAQPANHVAQANLASALNAAGRRGEAIDHFREAVRLKPAFSEGRYQLGLALAASGQLDDAVVELQEVVRRQPDAYRIRNNLGVVLFSAGRFTEAAREFEKTLELQPYFVDAQENLNRARQASVLPRRAE